MMRMNHAGGSSSNTISKARQSKAKTKMKKAQAKAIVAGIVADPPSPEAERSGASA